MTRRSLKNLILILLLTAMDPRRSEGIEKELDRGHIVTLYRVFAAVGVLFMESEGNARKERDQIVTMHRVFLEVGVLFLWGEGD